MSQTEAGRKPLIPGPLPGWFLSPPFCTGMCPPGPAAVRKLCHGPFTQLVRRYRVSSLRERRVLARTEAALRRADAGLSARLDLFAALADGEAMPRIEHLARRVLIRPLAALVLAAGIIIIAATGFAIADVSPCSGLPPYSNFKAQEPSSAGSDGFAGRVVHI